MIKNNFRNISARLFVERKNNKSKTVQIGAQASQKSSFLNMQIETIVRVLLNLQG